MRYFWEFNGRQVGAIGIFHACSMETFADSEREALDKVYEKFEHLTQVYVNSKPYSWGARKEQAKRDNEEA